MGGAAPLPFILLLLYRKPHRDNRPLADGAVQLDGRAQNQRRVLDDGQSQTGAANLLGVALVHPVKPLKHLWQILLRDALEQTSSELPLHLPSALNERLRLLGADKPRLPPVARHLLPLKKAVIHQSFHVHGDNTRFVPAHTADVLRRVVLGIVGEKEQNIHR